jgi:predicted  nucleic acid-binding Zn-ribbon protein
MAITNRTAMEAFFEEVKSIGLFGRLFSWGRIRSLSYEASNEYALLRNQRDGVNQQLYGLNQLLESAKREAEAGGREVSRLTIELTQARTALDEAKAQLNERITRIRELETSAEASMEKVAELRAQVTALQHNVEERNDDLTVRESRLAEALTAKESNSNRVRELEAEIGDHKRRHEELSTTLAECNKRITQFESVESSRSEEHADKMNELDHFMAVLKEDKARLEEERKAAFEKQFEDMKRTWLNHERRVEESLRSLCNKHAIEYVGKEKVPFKGKPDNTLMICEEYVIFDAKSPQGDDLTNFPDYVKKQSGDVQKYVKEASVKKDVYLVVPSNTINLFDEHTMNHGDYNVYVVTVDSLEPIILSLKKIEEYEFADQLSPEDRDSICRVIGRFSHLTKRRIQVDAFFCEESFRALKECGCLPEDMTDKMEEYERSTKVNPPVEQKAKLITERSLQKAVDGVMKETSFLGLETSETSGTIEALPLLKEGKRTDR